jgi:hypothetical protein
LIARPMPAASFLAWMQSFESPIASREKASMFEPCPTA